jgi:hypothetical protein
MVHIKFAAEDAVEVSTEPREVLAELLEGSVADEQVVDSGCFRTSYWM